MAKISRYSGDLKAFASAATGTNRTVFGDTAQADDLDSNVNSDFLLGWEIVGVNENPTKQDFNAFAYTSTQLMAYIHQIGVPEWSGTQEYHVGSIANLAGVLYVCKTNNHVSATSPSADATNWERAFPETGNASGEVPINNGTLNVDLNADQLDGYDAGNASGEVPINNGTVNTDLNADLLDGREASELAVRDMARGLVVKNNGLNPLHQVDISADEVLLANSSSAPLVVRELSGVTVDITTSGAGGLDTGSEANSTWYYVWVISDGTTTAGLLSTSSISPTMPGSYTYKALVGAIYNDASGDLLNIHQFGDEVFLQDLQEVLTNGTATSYTQVDLSAVIPPNATRTHGYFFAQDSSTAGTRFSLATDGSGNFKTEYQMAAGASTIADYQGFWLMPLPTAQSVYYEINSGENLDLWVSGWKF